MELIGRGTHVSEGSVKMDTAPENMVKLSYRFAETFQLVGAELVAAKKPATNFKLADSNIEEWMK